MSTRPDLSPEQNAELVPILTDYLDHANITLAEVRAMLHQGRHAAVARRVLRHLDYRASLPVGSQSEKTK